MASCSLLLIVAYRLIGLILNQSGMTQFLQEGIVIVVLIITAYRFIKSDVILNNEKIIIQKGFFSLTFEMKEIIKVKKIVEEYGYHKELVTIFVYMKNKSQPIMLTLDNPELFLKELLAINSEIEVDENLFLLNKNE